MKRLAFLATRLLTLPGLALLGCGGAVAPGEPGADSGTKTTEAPIEWKETASCAETKASCIAPNVLVRGLANGLKALDGARVEFAVRYILEDDIGTEVPRGVAHGRTVVRGEGFESCVCVPDGKNDYTKVASVVYALGSTGVSSRDVARASFQDLYVSDGDDDVSRALVAAPPQWMKEAAVAAMIERTENVAIGFDVGEKDYIYAGIVADDRPVAPELAQRSGPNLQWLMPGRPSTTERIAFFFDRNGNGKCDLDGSDEGAVVPFAHTLARPATLLSGASLGPICDALLVETPRY